MSLIFHFEQQLLGWPDELLTVLLIISALLLVLIALRGTALQKAVALTWVVLP